MEPGEHEEVLRYLDKFRDVFNDMTKEVMESALSGKTEVNPLLNADKVANILSRGVKVDPAKLVQDQMSFLQTQMALWQGAAESIMAGKPLADVVPTPQGDKRFKDGQWTENPLYNYFKQSYLLNAEMLQKIVESLEFEDPKSSEQVKFYTRQFVNSMSPTNYVLTNPEVCRDILDSKGACLTKGIDNFLRDLQRSPIEAFKVGQVEPDAFELGKTLAYTKGKVIYQNDVMQLIQYSPSTEQVFEKPLLIIPPFINKYYILDLDHKKSMPRWLVEQGYTVFMVSWFNPDESHRNIGFDDLVKKGVIEALDAVVKVTNCDSVNTAGYCVGGTLLSVAQAYLSAKGDKRINTLTLLTTLLDFAEPGEVGIYLSETSLPHVFQNADKKGYFDGRILALGFSLLRENNLFWSYFVDNYLKGKDPVPFDILYWNSDSNNITAKSFIYYVKNMYQYNKLIQPGALEIDGQSIDLGKIKVPTYAVATVADHIVLWQSAYDSVQYLGADVRFILAGSGHVAGIVNPAESGKYDYWVGKKMPKEADQWMAEAKQQSGSWWLDWNRWLKRRSGSTVDAREPGAGALPALEDAPGSYVRVRLESPIE